jgi:uncharacterized protein YigE (DUF2233 family)
MRHNNVKWLLNYLSIFFLAANLFLVQGCSSENGELLEVDIICLNPIVKSKGMPIPEKLAELFVPFGDCDGFWYRINPTFLLLDKMDQGYTPSLLGKTFAGNMNNKKLVNRLINNGVENSKVPEIFSEMKFKKREDNKNLMSDHLSKFFYIVYSTKSMVIDSFNGFKINFDSESVFDELNKYICENKENRLPIRIILNPSQTRKDENLDKGLSQEDEKEKEGINEAKNGESGNKEEIKYSTTDGRNNFLIFRIPFNDNLSSHFHFVRNVKPNTSNEFLNYILNNTNINSLSYFKNSFDFFAITGGMYEFRDKLPPGLIIDKGRILKPLNFKRGKGNFYEPSPNGVFYIGKNTIGIIESKKFQINNDIEFAIQTGPMMIIDDAINHGFDELSDNRHVRSAIGISGDANKREIVFVTSINPVNFHEISNFMKIKQLCNNALHLESVNAYMSYPGYSYYPSDKLSIMNLIVIR